jgi:hypothetical protein
MRRAWNNFFLWADRKRNNPDITLGWTILAQKLNAEISSPNDE